MYAYKYALLCLSILTNKLPLEIAGAKFSSNPLFRGALINVSYLLMQQFE